jgi:hypothetical protein
MFGARASKEQFFTGIIKWWKGIDGNTVAFSRIVMPNGLLCAQAQNQKELGENLDKMCVYICNQGLHDDDGIHTEIFGTDLFLN